MAPNVGLLAECCGNKSHTRAPGLSVWIVRSRLGARNADAPGGGRKTPGAAVPGFGAAARGAGTAVNARGVTAKNLAGGDVCRIRRLHEHGTDEVARGAK